MEELILAHMQRPGYKAVKPTGLARQLKIAKPRLPEFHAAVERLIEARRIKQNSKGIVRPMAAADMLVGVIRRSPSGAGSFYPHESPDWLRHPDLRIQRNDMQGAHTGDEVLVRVLQRRAGGGKRTARVVEILQRATKTFVGTYKELDGEGFVQVDGTAFPDAIAVGDPGAKGAQPNDKVVIEMLRFPMPSLPGEAVLVEVLGARGKPGVDTISIIHEFGLPNEFPEEVLEEAREVAAAFDPKKLGKRKDLTKETIVTIDPVDARDFDDAISLRRARNGHWHLGVHIADVSHFVPHGSKLDEEARKRGTSVYLPDRVIPMLPELISNGLASLQEGKVRFTKTAQMEFTSDGIPVHAEFFNSAINVKQRFAYEEVMPIVANPDDFKSQINAKIRGLLLRMHEFAMILRKRRFDNGSINLDLPEVKIDLDKDGKVVGAHETDHDESHQIIEEFMLAANVAVATDLADRELPFLRRVHGDPSEQKLRGFAEFVEALGFRLKRYQSRADLQALIESAKGKPTEHAVNYALLRSLKQAEYTANDLGHYALAFEDYCHFTSPIRRYPDLTLHRLYEQIFAGKKPRETDVVNVERLAKHCSMTERRAANAERTLTRVKLLSYMADKIGTKMEAVITGVETFGIFCRGIELPVEGMVHVSALGKNDFFDYDRATMSLTGRRKGRSFQLGDRVWVEVAHVDVDRRELDFRLSKDKTGKKSGDGKRKKNRPKNKSSDSKRKGKKKPPPKSRGSKPKQRKQTRKRPRR